MTPEQEKLREALRIVRGDIRRIREIPFPGPGSQSLDWTGVLERIADAAESTLPKTKMVEVWRVTYAEYVRVEGDEIGDGHWLPLIKQFHDEKDARGIYVVASVAPFKACAEITGPHMQEIPCE